MHGLTDLTRQRTGFVQVCSSGHCSVWRGNPHAGRRALHPEDVLLIVLGRHIQTRDCTGNGLKACMMASLAACSAACALGRGGHCAGGLMWGAAVPLPLGILLLSKQQLRDHLWLVAGGQKAPGSMLAATAQMLSE